MIIRASVDFTDKETKNQILSGEEMTVPRKRGLELINKGFARLISDDDRAPETAGSNVNNTEKDDKIKELESLIEDKDKQIAELEARLAENNNLTSELSVQSATSKKAKNNG